ncbi:inner nuclear membrane protein enriched at telomere/subtelomere region [Myotisia sp. PD_48]|nr:inner nuclear membrane protein enriched at telomere/subtelomere region [Myotisia sp. PD_48]
MASDTDNGPGELFYLIPGFDLNTLTVPHLRSILVSHDISYPASAKKAQLIEILKSEVLPKAKKLLRQRERVRRTSRGITNMPNDQDSSAYETQEIEDVGRTPKRSTRSRAASSRPSTRASNISEADGPIPPLSVSKRRTTKVATKHPRSSDTETQEDLDHSLAATPLRPSGRKSRRSEAYPTPSTNTSFANVETPITENRQRRDVSVFTDDNPFQRGSPIETPRPRTMSSERRRKSTSRLPAESAMAVEERKRLRTDPRLSSRIKREEGFHVPTRSTFDIPLAKLQKMPNAEEESDFDDLKFGEEFTPEEQLALESEEAVNGRRSILRKTASKPKGRGSAIASWFVILTLLTSFGAWWRKEKLEIGYCGVGKAHWSLEDTKVPSWANAIEPHCETCPQHAFCYSNLETRCEQGFMLKSHPLSLGGIVPLPPTCEPDGEKARRVKVVADKAIDELRERRAKYECGDQSGESADEITSPDMSAAELREKISKQRRKGMSDEEFEDLWKGALGEITRREEVVATTGPSSSSELSLSSTSVAKLPLSCAFRRHLRLTLLAYRLPILVLIVGLVSAALARAKVLAQRSDAARVPHLVGMTLDRLATQAALHARGEALEAWISAGQLRDDVLRDELQGSRREKLWKRVRAVVEGNANVRASVREGRGGDVSRVWEWIGGIGGVAGSDWDAPSRRDSGKVRFSLGPADSPTTIMAAGQPGGRRESKKWDEARPIY